MNADAVIRAVHRYLAEQERTFDGFEIHRAEGDVRVKATLNGCSSEFAFDAFEIASAEFAGTDIVQTCMDALRRALEQTAADRTRPLRATWPGAQWSTVDSGFLGKFANMSLQVEPKGWTFRQAGCGDTISNYDGTLDGLKWTVFMCIGERQLGGMVR